ncbi:MAG: hypothetical protein SRB2_03142 [Desulfobacteraceae bacterium Eth-SRB2]|nr:MAG: hypothetical protein SRB2_03142 [Desulfobacteraceae bacterium Eth-SRB2]
MVNPIGTFVPVFSVVNFIHMKMHKFLWVRRNCWIFLSGVMYDFTFTNFRV